LGLRVPIESWLCGEGRSDSRLACSNCTSRLQWRDRAGLSPASSLVLCNWYGLAQILSSCEYRDEAFAETKQHYLRRSFSDHRIWWGVAGNAQESQAASPPARLVEA
jgi:hypothetical protein